MKKITFSIGVPILNEEANIANLLQSIKVLEEGNYKIKEIIIISDGSTDDSVNVVKRIHDKRIKIIEGQRRLGKFRRLNEMLKAFNSDFLLTVDGDCLLDRRVLKISSVAIQKHTNIDLIMLNDLPVDVDSFVEKVLESSIKLTINFRSKWRGGDNVYAINGRGIIISRKFAKSLTLPALLAEDAYIYLEAKNRNLKRILIKPALVYYHLPKSLNDYFSQSIRFMKSIKQLNTIFPNCKEEFNVPASILIKETLKEFARSPIYFSVYLLALFSSRVSSLFRNVHPYLWSISLSTKK